MTSKSDDSQRRLRNLFWILLLANAAFIFLSSNILKPLASRDIIGFEIARTVENAETILHQWTQAHGKLEAAVNSIYLDYIFIILYTAGLGVACRYLSKCTRHDVLTRAGRFFSILVLGAGICDVIENLAMTYSLTQNLNAFNVRLAYNMAVAKFSVVILCILFMLICLIFLLIPVREEGFYKNGNLRQRNTA